MPTYEYACKSCGEHVEVVQSFKDDPLTECPHCAGPLRKVFGNIGIAFKGSGFYKTDSRSSTKATKPAAASSDSGAGSGGSGSSGSGSSEKSGSGSGSGDSSSSSSGGSSSNSSGTGSASPAKAS